MRGTVGERIRAVLTLSGVLGVVVGEFFLLSWVYHSGDDQERAQADWVRVEAVVAAWEPGDSAAPVVQATTTLATSDAPGAADLRAAASRWSEDPTTAGLAGVRERTDAVGAEVADALRRVDRRVTWIYVGLLAAATVGWFLWFRRVVRRHRERERELTEAAMMTAGERRLTALVQNSSDLVLVLEQDGCITYASPSSEAIVGTASERLVSTLATDLFTETDGARLLMDLATQRHGDQALVLRAQHPDGRSLDLEGTLTNLLDDDAVNGWVLTVRDVTDRLALQEELSHQALHDALTGLANRRLFGERLDHALRPRGKDVAPAVVLYLDLDDFKDVNDSLGHGAGDHLLQQVAERITGAARAEDTASRLGGDEFAILMEDADLAAAQLVAERLVEAMLEPFLVGDVPQTISASVGLAEARAGQVSAEEVLRNADVAMYWAKNRAKGTVAVYEADLHAQALDRLELTSQLRTAIREGQLVLHYQATVDLAERRISGFEALVRWQHPTRGLVPPDSFIALAEQSGLIVSLGSWVLREACVAALRLGSGPDAPTMAVNVAAKQLARASFVTDVLGVLAETGLPARRLTLEITESVLLDDKAGVVRALGRLRDEGVRIAIDDFGTGYSSLSYLAELPVDVLKIDKAFVDHVGGSQEGASLVQAILTLSESLHLSTVAEGVEQHEQADWLTRAGCTTGQGYLWSRPIELEAAMVLLAEGPAGVRPDDLHHASATP